ncbi:MFS transporter [Amycolatopsis sp. H20-H5]|uniref:MFS transporter n=1 Tax=Amycolatopsis sp. H20-H5 TaxID=3046309 RepID=UPI002DB8F39B|nr:MFS transporter [Amycolatopsis sp. H20-H5]MEC3977561.1 MFS transporter [Amycolatopsis sp. H20-H5]
MYLSSIRGATTEGEAAQRWKRVGGTVFALGAVSLITDISAEMVTAVLPAFLVLGLRISVAQYGVLDGLYTGVTAVTRLLGGYTADRWRARKAVAGTGYAMSAVAKLGLLAAGPSVSAIGGALAADRIGKGLRTAPRDAMITASAPPSMLGRAFGVHRTMDTIGAFLGPLVALAVLAMASGAFDAIFVISFCVAVLGVLVLVLFVRDRPAAAEVPSGRPRVNVLVLLRDPRFRRVQYAAALLGLMTIGDGFVYLVIQQWQHVPVLWFPLLAAGSNAAYLVLATPLGMLADRFGRWRVVVGGHLGLLLVYVLLATQQGGWFALAITLALYGVFYAATDGVLIAVAGPLLPEHLRTTGIALLQTGQALAYLVSSVVFGLVWGSEGASTACWLAAAGVLVALPLAVRWLRGAAVAT